MNGEVEVCAVEVEIASTEIPNKQPAQPNTAKVFGVRPLERVYLMDAQIELRSDSLFKQSPAAETLVRRASFPFLPITNSNAVHRIDSDVGHITSRTLAGANAQTDDRNEG